VCGIDYRSPSSAEIKERVKLYLYSPPWIFLVCSTCFTVTFYDYVFSIINKKLLLLIQYQLGHGHQHTSNFEYSKSHPVFLKFSTVKELSLAVLIGCVDVDMRREPEARHVTANGNRGTMCDDNRSIDGWFHQRAHFPKTSHQIY
jgi:hypothetical protein